MLIKRIFDIIFAMLGLLIFSPIFVIIAILIRFDSKGSIFFRQVRVGQFGHEFRIFKFRTMVNNAEALGSKITVGHDVRITKIGAFLRKYKLDELPQLIDVFRGTMSFVGPRPEVPEYVRHYPTDIKQKVLSVKPGITDNASIAMIDESSLLSKASNPTEYYISHLLPLKLDYAIKYIDNRSLLLDIKIIFLTLFKIFNR